MKLVLLVWIALIIVGCGGKKEDVDVRGQIIADQIKNLVERSDLLTREVNGLKERLLHFESLVEDKKNKDMRSMVKCTGDITIFKDKSLNNKRTLANGENVYLKVIEKQQEKSYVAFGHLGVFYYGWIATGELNMECDEKENVNTAEFLFNRANSHLRLDLNTDLESYITRQKLKESTFLINIEALEIIDNYKQIKFRIKKYLQDQNSNSIKITETVNLPSKEANSICTDNAIDGGIFYVKVDSQAVFIELKSCINNQASWLAEVPMSVFINGYGT